MPESRRVPNTIEARKMMGRIASADEKTRKQIEELLAKAAAEAETKNDPFYTVYVYSGKKERSPLQIRLPVTRIPYAPCIRNTIRRETSYGSSGAGNKPCVEPGASVEPRAKAQKYS